MSTQSAPSDRKVTLPMLAEKKQAGTPITMLTAYDFPGARLVDAAGIDIVLVGDSLAMTVLGHPDTVSVTMDEMLHHCKAVARGAERAFRVGDMPFMSYQSDPVTAVRNAGRFLKEGRMEAVKLEGGADIAPTIERIVRAGIPVMGHLGLTPQSVTKLGGYRVQGKSAAGAARLLADAEALEAAGCFAVVLEAVPAAVAAVISGRLTIPTIGIGAGRDCGGQVLVFHDILGLFDAFVPKFVKQYATLRPAIVEALTRYREDVEARRFPDDAHSFAMPNAERERFLKEHGP